MRIRPELDEIVYGERGMLKAIEVVVAAQCLVSATILVFAAIDSLSALTRPIGEPDTSRDTFTGWCDRYLLASDRLGCSSIDLYAARCGVLHTYSPASSLGRRGDARPLAYEWRAGPSADAAVPLAAGTVVVQMESLLEAVREAIRLFLIDCETDSEIRHLVEQHMESLLCYAPWPRMYAVMEATVA